MDRARWSLTDARLPYPWAVAGHALAVGLLGGVLGVIALSVVANRVKTGSR